MNIIIMGFCGSGSSAVEDLLREYDNCSVGSYKRFEHVLFYVPDGLFDLEDRLLYNNSIHMFDAAIKRFRAAMKRLNDTDYGWFGGYENRTNGQFMKIVDQFIDSLIQYQVGGTWSDDIVSIFSVKKAIKDCLKKMSGKEIEGRFGFKNTSRSDDDNKVFFSFVSKDYFYEQARKFVDQYCNLISKDISEHFLFDQLLLPQNLGRIKNYFDTRKYRFIIVDRDPRDLFVLSKYVWPSITGVKKQYYPDKVSDYIGFHKGIRAGMTDLDESLVLKISFEDLLYKYEETKIKIEQYLGLDCRTHTNKQLYFKIEQSIKNTQNFLIDEKWKEETEVFNDELSDYIYKFPVEIKVTLNETTDP